MLFSDQIHLHIYSYQNREVMKFLLSQSAKGWPQKYIHELSMTSVWTDLKELLYVVFSRVSTLTVTNYSPSGMCRPHGRTLYPVFVWHTKSTCPAPSISKAITFESRPWNNILKQECIPVGCIPAERWPYSENWSPPRKFGADTPPENLDQTPPRKFEADTPPPRKFGADPPSPENLEQTPPKIWSRHPPRKFARWLDCWILHCVSRFTSNLF